MAKKKKKKEKKKKEKKEVFYVGVQDPVEVRRTVLETSKDMVEFLQKHEKLKAVRDEKTEAIRHLREDVRQLKTLINKLRRALPKTKLRVQIHKEHEVFTCEECGQEFETKKKLQSHKKKHQKKTAKKTKPKKTAKKEKPKETPAPAPQPPKKKGPETEIEKLESELADIEGKLGKLE